MTLLNFDARLKANALPDSYGLRFGARTGPGGGTNPARFAQQVTVHDDPQWGHVLRALMAPGDTAQWAAANQTVPCVALVGSLDCRVNPGDEGWMHLVCNPIAPEGDLVWEWHNSGSVRSTIAPYAFLPGNPYASNHEPWETFKDGKLVPNPNKTDRALTARIVTGKVPTGGGGAAYWHTNIAIPGFQPCPPGWIHILMGAKYVNEGGWYDLTVWKDGDPVPAQPQIRLDNIPTMAWEDGRNDSMYPQWGIYGYPSQQKVYDHAGWTVRPTKAQALADFGGAPPVDKYAAVRAEMNYFKTSSPHIYNACDELLKLNP